MVCRLCFCSSQIHLFSIALTCNFRPLRCCVSTLTDKTTVLTISKTEIYYFIIVASTYIYSHLYSHSS